MIEVIGRRTLQDGEAVRSEAVLLQVSSSQITVEAARHAWPDTGQSVIEIVVYADENELGRFASAGGDHVSRDGTLAEVSAATFFGDFQAGTLLSVAVRAFAAIDTGVRLAWR